MPNSIIPKDYSNFLEQLKQKVLTSRLKAVRAVNTELIALYYHIGSEILVRQKQSGWGAKIIDKLSVDLSKAFPDTKGFSIRNLKYMRKFAEDFPDDKFVQQLVAQLPWGHIVFLMNLISKKEERIFYIENAVKYGWSRNVMVMQIESDLYSRQGKAITNFKQQLLGAQSDLANQTLKDPYIFDFLNIGKEAEEREVEKALIKHIENFLLELGEGFAFVGRQYHLEVANQDFYLDLLFYHLKLRCFVVIDLKSGEFKPEYTGKMNFYLSAVDDLVKHSSDNPTIGLILCKSKNNVLAEYALRDMTKPIGLSEYRLTKNLPKKLQTLLPTIEELESELKE